MLSVTSFYGQHVRVVNAISVYYSERTVPMASHHFSIHCRHASRYFIADMRYLRDMGVKEETSPEGNYVFNHYVIEPGGAVSKPVMARMKYPDWYLKQLSAT